LQVERAPDLQTESPADSRLTVPIVQAPIGGAAGPRLVAAAANAGALAVLPIWFGTPKAAIDAIERTRALTDKPFAVNLRADLNQDGHIAAALEAGVTTIHLFWGDPASAIAANSPGRRAHDRDGQRSGHEPRPR